MTAECLTPILNMMARHGSQDHARDDDAASDVNFKEILYSVGFPYYTEPSGDYHSGHPRTHSAEGQQYFHTQSGALNGIADSYDSARMAHMSWSVPAAVNAQSYVMDSPQSWNASNPPVDDLSMSLGQYFSQSSHEAVPSPPMSVGTLASEYPDRAQSAELHPNLSQMSFPNSSGHSEITDSSLSLLDTAYYPSSPFKTESHAYSESTYADELNPMRRGSFHNGAANGIMRRPGRLLSAADSSFSCLASPEEVTLTSPMDLTSGQFESHAPGDDFSLDSSTANNPNWSWDSSIDQGDSRVSTPFSADGLFPALQAIKSPVAYSSSPTDHSPRTSRRATATQGSRILEDTTAAYRRASHSSGVYDGAPALNRSQSRGSNEAGESPRDHVLYHNVSQGADGLYHCPWEGDPNCTHKPEKLKCNYDKFVDSHLKPYRCKVQACENARFSSTACLLRHEREAHAMHGHGEKPFLCKFEGCDRGTPGNGFPRHWNLCDHMKRVHNRSPTPPPSSKSNTRSKKRKNDTSVTGSSKKAIPMAEQPATLEDASSLDEEFHQRGQQLLLLFQDTAKIDTFATMEIMASTAQRLKSSIPKMERIDSQQSSG